MEQSRSKGRWFKLAEAAQQLGISEITVRRKAKSGQLKAIMRNGRYMVYLEEDEELGMFTAALDSVVARPLFESSRNTLESSGKDLKSNESSATAASGQDDLILSLKRTIEDQQTLISSLEASISRLSQKLSGSGERYSNR